MYALNKRLNNKNVKYEITEVIFYWYSSEFLSRILIYYNMTVGTKILKVEEEIDTSLLSWGYYKSPSVPFLVWLAAHLLWPRAISEVTMWPVKQVERLGSSQLTE